MMTADEEIDLLIARRNDLQFQAENISKEAAQKCWTLLGVANRHFEGLVAGTLPFFQGVKEEIEKCFVRCVDEMSWRNK